MDRTVGLGERLIYSQNRHRQDAVHSSGQQDSAVTQQPVTVTDKRCEHKVLWHEQTSKIGRIHPIAYVYSLPDAPGPFLQTSKSYTLVRIAPEPFHSPPGR